MAEVENTAESSGQTPYKFEVQDLAVHEVTVYKDRAEVKRMVPVLVKTVGDVEVQIQGLCNLCDLDSIRVEGKGKAVITEVSSLEKTEAKKADPNAMKSVREEINDLEKRIRVIETERERVTRRKQLFVGLADQIRNPSADTSKQSMVEHLLSKPGLDGVVDFMNLYSDQLKYCDEEAFKLEASINQLREEIRALRDKEMEAGRSSRETRFIRQTSILMDVKEAGEVVLTVTYIVSGATWYPKYDIRAYSADKTTKITYFGVVNQRTGEDWPDARLILSTAQPSIGGNMPELPSQIVDFKMDRPSPSPMRMMYKAKRSSRNSDLQYDGFSSNGMVADSLAPEMLAPMAVMTADVTQGMLSTMYNIPRQATIPSDKQDHKVVVAIIDLKADFEHFAVPKMVPNTYLKAKLTNTSSYLLLTGQSNIFVDNNFMTKSTLPTVSPNEEFEVSLGMDFAVRISYKPCQKIVGTSGIFTKTAATQFKQVTEVKNTHQYPVRIQIEEQLPRSETDKIKVNLMSPALPKEKEKDKTIAANAPVSQNAKGNIVWRESIKAGATHTFTLHYAIEKSADSREVVFSEL